MANAGSVPSRRYFEEFSEKTGFLSVTLEKIYRVIQLVGEIQSLAANSDLALRGGTAINLVFLPEVARLSVDIDLVYVGSYKKQRMIEDRKDIDGGLKRVFRYLGYPVKNPKSYALDQYQLRYRNNAGSKDTVKVEVNYLSSRVPVLKPVSRRLNDIFGLGGKEETMMLAPEELYGSKVKALIERAQPRDLFDVSILQSQLKKLDFRTLRRASIFYCALELESDFRGINVKKMLGQSDERHVRNVLRPTLAGGYELDVRRMRSAATKLVSRIAETDRSEKQFLDGFYSGKYRPELLFPENELLKHHPGAEWRMRHLNEKPNRPA